MANTELVCPVANSIPLMLHRRSLPSASASLKLFDLVGKFSDGPSTKPQIGTLDSTLDPSIDSLTIKATCLVPLGLDSITIQDATDSVFRRSFSRLELSLCIIACQENGALVEFTADCSGGNPTIDNTLLKKMGFALTNNSPETLCSLPISFRINIQKAAYRHGIQLNMHANINVKVVLSARDTIGAEYTICHKTTTTNWINESRHTTAHIEPARQPTKRSRDDEETRPGSRHASPRSTPEPEPAAKRFKKEPSVDANHFSDQPSWTNDRSNQRDSGIVLTNDNYQSFSSLDQHLGVEEIFLGENTKVENKIFAAEETPNSSAPADDEQSSTLR